MSRSSLGTVRLAAVAAAVLLAAAPSQVPTIAYNTRTSSLTATASYYQVGPALGDCRPAATVNGLVHGCNYSGALYDFWAVANRQAEDHHILWSFAGGLRSVTHFQLITFYRCDLADPHRLLHFSLDYTTDPNPSLSSVFVPLEGLSLAGAASTIRGNEVVLSAPAANEYLIRFPRVNATAIRLHSYPDAGLSRNRNFVITEVSFETAAPVLVDADRTSIAAAPTIVSARDGRSMITVTPRDSAGADLGPRLSVALATTGGALLGTVVDQGDGTYTQVLAADTESIGATVSATVEGIQVAGTAEVTFVHVDPVETTIAASPDVVSATGGRSVITVVPRGPSGAILGRGLSVVLATTGGTLVDPVADLGDGSYTQVLLADTSATGATVSATVQGVPIETTAEVRFFTVGADQTTVAASPAVVSAFAGQTTVTVVPRDATGASLGAGLSVILTTSGGTLLGAVADQGDGSYTQVLAADSFTSGATVSAGVQGVPITDTAVVRFVAIDPSQSSIMVSPETVYLGGRVAVTVVPRDDRGFPVTGGRTVLVSSTLGDLVGTVAAGPDGSYTQTLNATAVGTASVTASVDGLELEVAGTIAVLDPHAIGVVIGLRADQTAFGYASIQHAVNRVSSDRTVRILVTPGAYREVVRISCRTRLTIEGLSILGAVRVEGFRIDRCRDLTLRGMVIEGPRRHGPGIHVAGGARASSRVLVQECLVRGTGTGQPGIAIGRGNGAVTIFDCLVEGCGGDGIVLHGDGGAHQIVRSIVQGNRWNGVHASRNVAVAIVSCRIENNGLGGEPRCGYAILRERSARGGSPRSITLVDNVLSGNRGKVIPGRSDREIGNRDQVIDATDDQPGY